MTRVVGGGLRGGERVMGGRGEMNFEAGSGSRVVTFVLSFISVIEYLSKEEVVHVSPPHVTPLPLATHLIPCV